VDADEVAPSQVDLARLQQRIERSLLGRRRYTRLQVAELAGIDPAISHKLWLALGFAEVGEGEVVFTDRDVSAMRMANDLVTDGIIDEQLRTSVTRMLGQTMSRMAEWETRRLIEVIAEDPGSLTSEREIVAFITRVLPRIQELQNFVWRRHLAAHADRALGGAGGEMQVLPQTVGFVDMAGYTSLSRRINEAQLEVVLERFESLAAEVIARHHGRIIKSLGDEVLFVADDPGDAAEIALTMIELAAADEALPGLHAGLALGDVLWRFGDVYGSVVNIASRLTSVARAGTVLTDLHLAAKLRGDDRFVLRRVRPATVRGFVHLQPSLLRRTANRGSRPIPLPSLPDPVGWITRGAL
jgi:adenylate cyclase